VTNIRPPSDFPENAPCANPVFFRTYSRRGLAGTASRETWAEVCQRTVAGLSHLGQFTPEETALVARMQQSLKALPSGRWLWVGGTGWIERAENFSGSYNCTSTNVVDWRAFGLMMDLAMMGCGTGAVLEPKYIEQLPPICNHLTVNLLGAIGTTPPAERQEETRVTITGQAVQIQVGDSRQGWVQSYQTLLECASDESFKGEVQISVDLSDIRPSGETLKGFGGMANPIKLPELYTRCTRILNKAIHRRLNSIECCLLIDEAASCIVAGNIRRSAGMRQFNSNDTLAATAKDNLWVQDTEGNWRVDAERDSLRMANHTRVYHHRPSLEECVEAVKKQYYSGEGAIQWAGEAVARANHDILTTPELKKSFLEAYAQGKAANWIQEHKPTTSSKEVEHRLERYGLNPCGEILGANFHCVSGETMLIVRDGMHWIEDLVGQVVEVWNGRSWSRVVPVQTGQGQELYRVRFNDGTHLDVTEKHRFFVKDRFGKAYLELTTAELAERIQTSEYLLHTEPFEIVYQDGKFVPPVLAYTLGQLVGDGSVCGSQGKPQLQLRLYGVKSNKVPVLAGYSSGIQRYYTASKQTPCLVYSGFHHDFDPRHVRQLKDTAASLAELASWDRESILNFVAGLADADGSAVPSGGIRIYLSDYERAYRVYLLLIKCGIRSSINWAGKAGEQTNLGTRKKDLWYLQVTDCAAIPCQRLDTSRGHKPQARDEWQVIRSVEPLVGRHNTFCFNEPEYHKGVFGGTLTGQCNLSEIHLNQIDPGDEQAQTDAFKAGALSVVALLNHHFQEERYQYSRSIDPIVGVSFTGLFDFFVQAFGVRWLHWWETGRPATDEGIKFKEQETRYLNSWRETVNQTVWEYCDRHGLNRPNRCTTTQPAGTKSLLSGAAPGWHPPKAQRYIRRITFAKNDPVALACLDFGYSVVPSQADKDEQGKLLDDPFDPRCTEWLVEIPVEVPWANLPGADEIVIEKFSALAQMDFYMQVQRHYTTHNTSATIELREDEIDAMGQRIFEAIQQDEGYVSAALLARFDAPFPRLPFEKIDRATFEQLSAAVLHRKQTADFAAAVLQYDLGYLMTEGPAGCDALGCLLPERKKN